jgi:tRNA(fMet)-specific endonuclease VapC
VILDTNGLSALADGDPALEPILNKIIRISIPVIVLGEYRYGISQSRYRKQYEQWLDEYVSRFLIFDVDKQTTVFYSSIRVELKKAGTPIPANDTWIAALCRQHNLPLLSRDRHFDLVKGIKRVEW